MISAFSVAIPLIFGLCIGETLSIYGTFGLISLALSIIILNLNGKKGQAVSKKWVFFIGVTFLTNWLCSVTQKVFQLRDLGLHSKEFTIVAMLLMLIVFFILAIINLKNSRIKKGGGKIFAVIAGVATAVVSFFTTVLTGYASGGSSFPNDYGRHNNFKRYIW